MIQSVAKLIPRSYNTFFGSFPSLREAQLESIPIVAGEKNLLLISPTGSGKTEAVIAPICEKALDNDGTTYCLYICPTKALVNDIERRIESPMDKLSLTVGVRHGDRKTMQGSRMPNVLITTPESLDVMLGSNRDGDMNRLRDVKTVIVDEVHQFYQTHRGYQLLVLLERLKRRTESPLQRILLSATVAQPALMAQWFQGSDRKFEVVQIRGGRRLEVNLDLHTAEDGAAFKEGRNLVDLIKPIVLEHKKVILFANSRNECDWLYWKLSMEKEQLPTEIFLHYSTLDKEYRETVEREFQRAHSALCIATSTLELGIDIGDVDAIVMYGAPASVGSFVQRVGRGNRRSVTSHVYGICRDYHINGTRMGAEQDLILFYALVSSMLESEMEGSPDAELYSVYVQQLFSLTHQYGNNVQPFVLSRVVERIDHPFINLDEGIVRILRHLQSGGYYTLFQEDFIATDKWEKVRQSLDIWGNIPPSRYVKVYDTDRETLVSDIPPHNARPGAVILCAGEPRIITEVQGHLVKTVPLAVNNPDLINYFTNPAPTPREVMEKAQAIMALQSFPDLPVEIEPRLKPVMKGLRQRFKGFDFEHALPYERVAGKYCYYTFGGTWPNKVLGQYLNDLSYTIQTDSWRIITREPIDSFANLPTDIQAIERIVLKNFKTYAAQMQFSNHFYRLPKDLQQRELISLVNLPLIMQFFSDLKEKICREVTPQVGEGEPPVSQHA